ncbi:MAG: hypothetical protein R2760_06210 [Chitinophagales bacterium]|nr:hypothetical protein [Chitinophagales bacterium]
MKQLITLFSFLFFASIGMVKAQDCPRHIEGDSLKTAPVYFYYSQYIKKKDFEKAYPFWRTLYDKAPGLSSIIFYDGEEILKDKIEKTKDNPALQSAYQDTLIQLYDKWVKCHGNDDYILGTKKAQAQIQYKNDISGAKISLERSLELSDKYPVVMQTYFNLLNYQYQNGQISGDTITAKYDVLIAKLDKNIAKNGQYVSSYKDAKTAIENAYIQNFADKSNPEVCAKLLAIYLKQYQANPNDPTTVQNVYEKTRGCADSALNVELLQKLNQLNPSYSYAVRLANIYIKANKLDEAYLLYENAIAHEPDASNKSDLYLLLANMKADKDLFPESRELARKALALDSTNARAYFLIGYLYASSGKLCSASGVGFQAQIVLWPAFDNFKKAVEYGEEDIKIEAQKMLDLYKQYLPTKADVAAKKLTVGAPYTVKCWIEEETTVQIK